MTVKSGLAYHCHHDRLFEYVYDYDERVNYIKEQKPKEERELRLRLFKLISADRLPQELNKAGEAFNKAREAYSKAREAYNKAGDACDKAGEDYNKAREAYNKAWEAYNKAREACGKAGEVCGKARKACNKAGEACCKTLIKYNDYLVELHKELCPDCAWDTHTIFTRKDKDGHWY